MRTFNISADIRQLAVKHSAPDRLCVETRSLLSASEDRGHKAGTAPSVHNRDNP